MGVISSMRINIHENKDENYFNKLSWPSHSLELILVKKSDN